MLTAPWRIEMFGGLRARQGDQSVERFRRGKEAALLAYLALFRQSHAREQLADRFWPEADADAGRASLRVALTSLRRRLEPPGTPQGSVLIADRTTVRLNSATFVTDVAQFEGALQAARSDPLARVARLQEAISLYAGELLPGYLDEWVGPERGRLDLLFVNALSSLAYALGEAGDVVRATDFALRAVAADPLHERAHLTLMRLYAQVGRAQEALGQYDRLRRLLRKNLSAVPSSEARQMAKELRARPEAFILVAPLASAPVITPVPDSNTPPLERGPGLHPGLPVQTTRFFGREDEIARILVSLRQNRLVTLTGPGGAGKTRLALEAAYRLATKDASGLFTSGGMRFVALADIAQAGLMLEAMGAAVCDKVVGDGDPLDQIAQALSERSTLLILDNFEHLIEEGGATLQRLLGRAGGLSCLVTSRLQLGLPGEQVHEVPPLTVPKADDTPVRLLTWPSVRLFVDRAQAKAPEFHVTAVNAPAVAALVRGLEGIPLALELAAAWSRVYAPAQMVKELTDRYGWLTKNVRGVADRHRTLRAAVAWSHDLLAPEAQELLARLSAFRGGWSLDAAGAVCRELHAAPLLAQLQEHSWVTSEEVGLWGADDDQGGAGAPETAMRFRMLETLREFAEERLVARNLEREARTAHLQCFLGLAERAEAAMQGRDQATWLARLGVEHDNLRAALDWATGSDVPAGRRLAVALWPFWEVRGHWREGQERAEALLHRQAGIDEGKETGADRTQDEEARGRLLTNLGALACRRGHHGDAVPYMREALSLWRRRDDAVRIGASLGNLGVAALEQQDYPAAEAYLEEARAVQETSGDRASLSRTINNLAILAWRRGDFAAARARYEEALLLKRAEEDLNGLASTLNNLAAMFKDQGDLVGARLRFEECRLLFERLGSGWQLAYVLCNLGDIAAKEGDDPGAQAYYAGSLARLLEHGDRRAAVSCLEGLTALGAAYGRWEEAAWLAGCAARLRAELDMPPTPEEWRGLEAAQEQVLSGLGTSGFRAAFEAGQNASLETAARHFFVQPERPKPAAIKYRTTSETGREKG